MKKYLLLSTLIFSSISVAQAKLAVVTTTPDLASIVSEIGGDDVKVSSVAKGTQDPHYIEAKPSYMLNVSRADLVVSVGLELEIGYLPPILQGARNPKVMPGSRGYLEAGSLIDPLEVPHGKVSRAEGDIHPLGNPHFMLDPIRAGEVAVGIAERMGEIDPSHAAQFKSKAQAIQSRLKAAVPKWQARIEKSGVKKIITYHKTLTYFLDRFHVQNPAILEPKPGIPPTAGHTLDVIGTIQSEKVPLILVENYFDPSVTNRIKESVPSVRVEVVPVSVEGAPGIKTVDDLFEKLVSAIERK